MIDMIDMLIMLWNLHDWNILETASNPSRLRVAASGCALGQTVRRPRKSTREKMSIGKPGAQRTSENIREHQRTSWEASHRVHYGSTTVHYPLWIRFIVLQFWGHGWEESPDGQGLRWDFCLRSYYVCELFCWAGAYSQFACWVQC